MTHQFVKEWFDRGDRDLTVSHILFQEGTYFDITLFHLHQAVEKYLKGFLICNGWGLKKIHDIEILISEAIPFEPEFQIYLDFGRKLTAFYFEERYPPGPLIAYSKQETFEMITIAEEIIEKIKMIARGLLST